MSDPYKLQVQLRNFSNYLLSKGWIYLLLLTGLFAFYILMSRSSIQVFTAFGLLPFGIISIFLFLKYSKEGFYTLFCLQFVMVILNSVTEIKMGLLTLALCLVISSLLIIRLGYERINWNRSLNGMLLCYLILGIYYIAQMANPNNVQEAWNITITHYLIYPVLCAILVPFAVRNIKGVELLLFIWSVFIIYATFRGYWQKNHGFNEKELYFLYTGGGAKTHIIWAGVRYFSCFTDAANYGVHMAMAITVFGISLFYIKNVGLKIYFALIVAASIYGMAISGTRAAIAIPISGLALYVLLSRSWKAATIGLLALLAFICFFRFTTLGNSNQYIRRIRTTFVPSKDASFQVRVHSRKQIQELMIHKPFGYGLGLSKAGRFPSKEVMPYAPDSWLVSVWVETGIVGLVLYLLVHGVLFAWCSWLLMFKIMNSKLRGLLAAWLCMNAGFFVAAYANDVMQYPNSIVIYTGFALCFAGPYIDKTMREQKEAKKAKELESQTT